MGLVGVPLLTVWVIGIPTIGLTVLFKYRHNLQTQILQNYFLLMYQGFTNERFYWEMVNTLRKIVVLALNVFLSTVSPTYKILFSIVFLYFVIRVQKRLQPYKRKENNQVDIYGIGAGIVTLY